MYGRSILFLNIVVLMIKLSLSKTIRVDITHSRFSSFDKLLFYTKDRSICDSFNARYVSSGFDTVSCECGFPQMFIGLNGQEPKCRDENYGRVFGKFIISDIIGNVTKNVWKREEKSGCQYSKCKTKVNEIN